MMSIGSNIAAAWIGGMTSDMSGVPISAMAPPNPPLESPIRMTAGMATA